jgi:hypothetical protein
MNAFFDHANEDLEQNHSDLLRGCLSKTPYISSEDVASIVRDAHNMKHYFDNLHWEILNRYASIKSSFPRRKLETNEIMD